MGFGVSGSTAIIFLGVLICTGTLYTAAAGTAERLTEAEQENHERLLDQRNTGIDIFNATYNTSDGNGVVIRANNTGSTTLSVRDTTVLADNEYQDVSGNNTYVDGEMNTDLWAPGETLRIDLGTNASRVKLVTETGVSDTRTVTVVS
ncbi:fla cluster protein FlaF [Halopelagius longus]|uniref:Fla cluster protein FlaF n=1 Tax=Halopelagius longus TaxID=1236180 RepID=A0A1H1BEE3_9EURY|nr:fla cluster protein FlaF [Halopelagius longus]RDI70759.1 fla cluster protein FlaF [Halopelagius longus]SDQ50374.1 flagellar protein FlaF [Halopelagius longus]